MGKPTIGIGTSPGDGTGDPARTAYSKTNEGLEHGFNNDVAGEIAALTNKATPVDADLVIIEDSAASNAKKKASLGSFRGLNQSQVDARVVAVAPEATQGANGPATSFTVGATVVDDGVFSYDFGSDILSAGSLIVAENGGSRNGVFSIRARASSAHCNAIVSNGITATTGALNGTTGADGAITIATHTDGKLYVENRSGGNLFFQLTINRTLVP